MRGHGLTTGLASRDSWALGHGICHIDDINHALVLVVYRYQRMMSIGQNLFEVFNLPRSYV